MKPTPKSRGFYFDPKIGEEYDAALEMSGGEPILPRPPMRQDWVYVLELRGVDK